MKRILAAFFAFAFAVSNANAGGMRGIVTRAAAIKPVYTVKPKEFYCQHLNFPVLNDGVTAFDGWPPWPVNCVNTTTLAGFFSADLNDRLTAFDWEQIQPGGYGVTPPAIDWRVADSVLTYLKAQGVRGMIYTFTQFPKWAMPDPGAGPHVCTPTSWTILDTWIAAVINKIQDHGLQVLGVMGPNEPISGSASPAVPGPCDHDAGFWTSNGTDRVELQNRIYSAVKAANPDIPVYTAPVNDPQNTGIYQSLRDAKWDHFGFHQYHFNPDFNSTTDLVQPLDNALAYMKVGRGVGRRWSGTEGGMLTSASQWAVSTAYTTGNMRASLDTQDIYRVTSGSCTSAGSGNGPSGYGSGISDGTCTWAYDAGYPAWIAQYWVVAATRGGSALYTYLWGVNLATPTYAHCTDGNFGGGRCNPAVLNGQGKAIQWAVNVIPDSSRWTGGLDSGGTFYRWEFTANDKERKQIVWSNSSRTSVAIPLPRWALKCYGVDLVVSNCDGSSEGATVTTDGRPVLIYN